MNKLYEVLEICLQDIEQGADIDTVLFRYPELADELRPILETSVNAKSMAVPVPSAEVVRRNRAKVLQRATQMRTGKTRSSKRVWSNSLRRLAVTLTVVVLLFVSGTRLVGAASTTVPGDNLYPVKRTWEDVLVLFTFNLQQREALEIEHENERHHELQELFAEGRAEDVEFSGMVTSQTGNEWVISGVTVVIAEQTEMSDRDIVLGSAVRVEGHTQANGAVVAEEIKLLPVGSTLPDLDDESEGSEEDHEGEDRQGQDSSSLGSEDESPKIEETESPEAGPEPKDESSEDGSNSDRGGSDSDNGDDNNSEDKGSVEDSNNDDSSHESSNDSGGGEDHSNSDGDDN